MSSVVIVAKGIKDDHKTDVFVWLDIQLGDFVLKEISPETYLVITENSKNAELLVLKSSFNIGFGEVIFQQIPIKEAWKLDKDFMTKHSSTDNEKESLQDQKEYTKKCDYLKSYENYILYNSKFTEQLNNIELRVIHESPIDPPVFIGFPDFINEAELKVMKFLRTIQKEDIFPRNEIIDEVKQSLICNKIISSLNERFQNEPVAFENNTGCIEAYFTEAKAIEDIQKYLKDNLYQEYISVNDVHKFEFIKKNLSKDIEKLIESKDFMIIFPENKSTDQGYSIVAFGNKTDFDNSKVELQKLIDCVESSEVTLNAVKVCESLEVFLTSLEYEWNVRLDRNIIQGSASTSPTTAIIKGIVVTLVNGNIEDQDDDILVNSTGKNYIFQSGKISNAISLKAGPDLQKECSKKECLSVGQVVDTGAYNLSCKYVFHCFAKEWKSLGSKESEKILMKLVTKCLEMANNKNLSSIAFPPIACGSHKMPAKLSAKSIFTAIENYDWTKSHSLNRIKLAINMSKNETFEDFKQVLDSKLNKANSHWKYPEGMKIKVTGSNKDNIKETCICLLSVLKI